MDEKTQELRDIFLDVSEDETVTEAQQDTHGSLASDDEVDARVAETVAGMRESFDFETTLGDDSLVVLVRAFYRGDDDEEIAATLDADVDADVDATAVRRARLDLHLLRPADTDTDVDLDALRDHLDAGTALDEVAASLDAAPETVDALRDVLRVRDTIQRTNARYPIEFEDALQDTQIAERLTHDAREDGLDEATEGQEVDVSF